MDQVSRPFQVVLVAVVAFAAIYFVALRPKPGGGGSSPAPAAQPAPTQTNPPAHSALPGGLGRSLDKARAAKAQSEATTARHDAASEAAGTDTTPAAPGQAVQGTGKVPSAQANARPAQAPPRRGALPLSRTVPPVSTVANGALASGSPAMKSTGLALALFAAALGRENIVRAAPQHTRTPVHHRAAPRHRSNATYARVTHALATHRVVVLLFWNRASSDDQAVHSELSQVSTRHGRVTVASASIRDVSRYRQITQGVQILQSPTVVVVDRKGRATLLAGFTDHSEIDQAVADAFAASRR